MCTRGRWGLLAVLLAIAGRAGAAGPEASLQEWWTHDHPVFVLVVADGLRADALQKDAPWDGPLMPEMRSRRDECLRFENVWSEFRDEEASFRQLVTGASPAEALLADPSLPLEAEFGPIRAEIYDPVPGDFDLDSLSVRLEQISRRNEAGILVVRLRDLDFPLRVSAETLDGLDPSPWAAESAGPVPIEDLAAKRMRQAVVMARSPRPLEHKLNDHDLEIYTWVVDGAHRALDTKLARILERLESGPAADRLSWAVTSPAAISYHRHGLDTLGEGAVAEGLHVPLWWHLPQRLDTTGSRPDAHVLRGLHHTLVAWSRSETGRGLFGPPSDQRLAFASGVRRLGRREQSWTQMRWADPDFALLDLGGTPPRIQLFDRRIDPEEETPRGAESEALWDSLRTELARRALGEEVELVVNARLDPGTKLEFAVDAPPARARVLEGEGVRLLPYAKGSLLRWTVPDGDAPTLRLLLPADRIGLRLRREGLGVDRVALGRSVRTLPVQGELRVAPYSLGSLRLLQEADPASALVSLWWRVEGWWTEP